MTPIILLVEDNPTDEKLTLRAFARCAIPHEIMIVRDGAEALDYIFGVGAYAGKEISVPKVMLLDLKLPRIDGLEVLRRIRGDARTKLLPVVILTASREQEDIVQSYLCGANAYVRKPVDFTQFVETAKTIGVFWLLMNESRSPHSEVA